jgi:hypothetical protein
MWRWRGSDAIENEERAAAMEKRRGIGENEGGGNRQA